MHFTPAKVSKCIPGKVDIPARIHFDCHTVTLIPIHATAGGEEVKKRVLPPAFIAQPKLPSA
jgi:hypothetical protein